MAMESPAVQSEAAVSSGGRWGQLVTAVDAISRRDAEIDYYYGSALAHLGRWEQARDWAGYLPNGPRELWQHGRSSTSI